MTIDNGARPRAPTTLHRRLQPHGTPFTRGGTDAAMEFGHD